MALRSRPPRDVRHPPKRPSTSLRSVRIIGGSWKRTPLAVLDAHGLRPTPDRVRETVFNWLSHLIPAGLASISVLDLFSGTGALGLESASRGARDVTLVDNNPQVVSTLRATLARLKDDKVKVERADALHYLEHAAALGRRFDLIFLDPPFEMDWLARLLGPVQSVLAPDGLLYIEAEFGLDDTFAKDHGLALLRADKAGQVFYHLLRRNEDAAGESPTKEEDLAC